ncbi:MAG: histidine triad nucleotide-binding protein [candidate division WOR-3 bacterium]
MNCVFCRIINREIPSDVIHETENVLVFRDINPQAPVHLLAIPKRHAERIEEIVDLAGDILEAISEAAEKLGLTDYRIVLNKGPQAGQAVPHLHFHILGGRQMAWPPG